MSIPRKKILFFAEPATFAHVARPVVLASILDPSQYEVSIATGADFKSIAIDTGLPVHDLWCIGSKAYLAAVDAGRVVFSYNILKRYVQEDLCLIKAIKPDIIVGDFRLSLAVSARLMKIPYVGISNAYWSPYAHIDYEIPTHPATKLLGVTAANYTFRLLRPLILAYHSLPMHRLCRKYGMKPLGFDLRQVFTEADISVFADIPEIVPVEKCAIPDRYAFIGPIIWSPKIEVPAELTNQTDNRPLVYISMGSSGNPGLLSAVVSAVASLNCRIAVATFSDSPAIPSSAKHIVISGLLPGSEIAAQARLVICNGGSPTTHQALQQGTPVLGIPANMDQLLNMNFIVATGAGLKVRADQVTHSNIQAAAQRILNTPDFSKNAQKIAGWFRNYLPEEKFPAIVNKISSRLY
ncbi:nucleotide disphospho-sugar-binding domain-containing protein [Nitrosomonas sp.]|uniref:glycosyltransferase n=1 Tax=Nitrosomonas sp. TaxID=42353 RepID=UPI0025F5BE09|nr:nucleotide disphospho-sugar-binding domain-containing protein [Nitrosomonas sp.]MCC6917084.1 glycosyl transferase family 1 [Nitrosomonas sp.]